MPRRRYTAGPTALEPLPRLSAEIGGPQLWIKRDDQLGLAAGGNKTRKLEFLVADAIAQGADTLITAGGVQSNHCRLTLAAAVREGLACRLVLAEDLGPNGAPIPPEQGGNPPELSGNFLLFDLLGAESVEVHPNGTDIIARMDELAEELREQGRNPYVIAVGGSSVTGALGYVDCARELAEQAGEAGLAPRAVVVASGSGGTQAGLVAGFRAAGADTPVVGITVGGPREAQEERVAALANEVAEFLGLPPIHRDRIVARDEFYLPGYALPNAGMIEAVRLFANLEGVLLDPVYTGKAAAGLLGLARSGKYGPEDALVLVHTGGVPALYAHAADFA